MAQERQSPTGKPMAPGTPRDVIHIRIGSIILVFCVAVGLLAGLSRVWWLIAVAVVIAVIVIADIVLAVRRQRRLGGGVESRG